MTAMKNFVSIQFEMMEPWAFLKRSSQQEEEEEEWQDG